VTYIYIYIYIHTHTRTHIHDLTRNADICNKTEFGWSTGTLQFRDTSRAVTRRVVSRSSSRSTFSKITLRSRGGKHAKDFVRSSCGSRCHQTAEKQIRTEGCGWCRKVNGRLRTKAVAEVEMTFNRKSIKLMN